LKFTNTWLKNNSKWYNSSFNKEIRINNLNKQFTIQDESEENLINVYCESDRKDIKDWMVDTYREFGEETGDKLMRFRQIYLTLHTHEKVLYDLYFTNMKSMRDIGEILGIPLSAVFSMLTELKQKIRDKYGDIT
jgi:DNA-directed RNA polymerase specialized sigma subunit